MNVYENHEDRRIRELHERMLDYMGKKRKKQLKKEG